MGANAQAEGSDPVFTAYLRAKGAADDAIRARTGLDWTIVRPGALTDADPTDRIALSATSTGRGSVPREDVATTLVALLDEPGTAGLTLELISGGTAVREAVGAVARG